MSSFLHSVAEDLVHRFGDDLKDIAIVFNNKRPIVFLKKHLADLNKKYPVKVNSKIFNNLLK